MKTASKILGALAIVMLIVIIALTFVFAVNILHGNGADYTNNDVYSIIAGGLSVALSMLGYVGFVFMCIFGGFLIIYLLCFLASYIKLFKGTINTQFITYSAVLSGVIMFFEIILFAFKPEAGWKTFTVLLISTSIMIAYAVVVNKYVKNKKNNIDENIFYDEPPEFEVIVKD